MKNRIDNKLLVVTIIGTIIISGCASKNIEVMNNNQKEVKVNQEKISSWKSLTKNKKEDCIDCYANIVKKPIVKVALVNDTVTSIDTYAPHKIKLEEYKNPYLTDTELEELEEDKNNYLVDSSYIQEEGDYKSLYAEVENSSEKIRNDRVLAKNSIQVGAFRKYAGAKVYAKRYSLLTSKYNVDIKENVKDNKPIYRVQIEGFSNEREAREFMNRYGLSGAFLVRR